MKKYKIVFSPTGGTEKVVNALMSDWTEAETIDLSRNDADYHISLEEDSLAVIAMPSFGGVAPKLALERLVKIQANHSKCAIAAVYGNRAYDDTLVQMQDYAEKAGFQVIAAVAAVAEHSIIHAYAAGRPDAKDCTQLAEFGKKILEKASASASDKLSVPGNRPYKESGSGMVPKAGSACTACGICAKACPAGAIDLSNPRNTDKSKCIGCMRCLSVCPANARSVNPIMTKIAALAIKKACSVSKSNELYL